jgi:glycosyltransferase involved in cell wall biosynthesis
VIPVAFDMRDPVRSGIARVARSMARAFVERDVAADYVASFCGPARQLEELGAGTWGGRSSQIIPWDVARFSGQAELSWPRVRMSVRESVWYFPHWDMPWIARPQRAIVLINDVIPIIVPGATTQLRREIARRWIRWSGIRARRIAVSTEFTKGEVLELWPDFAGKIHVVPLGVDPLFFGVPAPLPDALAKLAAAGPFMLSVGNRKSHKNLIMGPEVLSRLPDVRWVVMGESFPGWDEVAERAAKLGVAGRMHVLAPQPDAVLHSLYATAACLFFPSKNEGFGLPILEALASGTQVVAGAAGASMEILGGFGTVCPVSDADAFASGVQQALRSGPPGEVARGHAATFSWERSAGKLAKLVQSVARE